MEYKKGHFPDPKECLLIYLPASKKDKVDMLIEESNKLSPMYLVSLVLKNKEEALSALLQEKKDYITFHDASYNRSICHYLIDNGVSWEQLEHFISLCEKNDSSFSRTAFLLEASFDGETPLHRAAFKNRSDLITKLLTLKIDLNQTSKLNETALHYACKANHTEAASTLIEKGALLNISNAYKQTPFFEVVKFNNPRLIKLFLTSGAQTNLTDVCGRNLLHIICKNNRPENIRLIDNADHSLIKRKNKFGQLPLHEGIQNNSYDLVNLLLNLNSPLNEQDNKGDTPLHIAFRLNKKTKHDWDMIMLLIKKGSLLTIKNKASITPMDLLKENIKALHEPCIHLILEALSPYFSTKKSMPSSYFIDILAPKDNYNKISFLMPQFILMLSPFTKIKDINLKNSMLNTWSTTLFKNTPKKILQKKYRVSQKKIDRLVPKPSLVYED